MGEDTAQVLAEFETDRLSSRDRTRGRVVTVPEGAAAAAYADPSAYSPSTPAEEHARLSGQSEPGRFSNVEPNGKPTAKETEWRSRYHVSSRQSADGNSYAPGEPIPVAEAIRQGIAEEFDGRVREKLPKHERRMRIPAATCPRCRGTGKFARMKNHRPDCGCPGCKPCPECEGRGTIGRRRFRDGAGEEHSSGA